MENSNLVLLESLLNEFYSPSCLNSRKKDIEKFLNEFQNNPENQLLAVNSLGNFKNQYVWFFAVSSVENIITKKWFTNFSKSDRQHIRDSIWKIYVNFPLGIVGMQREKIAQLLALIGKREFPEEHPEYVDQIISLLKSKFVLGIVLLKATSDEICSSKPDVSSQQKKNFSQCMSMCLGQIIPILNKFLTLCVCRVSNSDVVYEEGDVDLNLAFPNDNRFNHNCSELMVCIQQIFSWAFTLDTTVTPEFFNNIFELCTFSSNFLDVNLAALSTISELFYLQRQIPLAMVVAHGITELIQQKSLLQSNEQYQDKLSELLRLFTTQQWSIWVKDNCFPSKDFLLYLFNFTFSGISCLTFTERLSIWKPIMKSFKDKTLGRYTETVLQICQFLFKKMQFSLEQNELDLLDFEELDENMETELQHFLNQCIDMIGIAAELEPEKVFDLIVSQNFNRADGHFHIFITLLNTLPDFSKESTKTEALVNEILNCFNSEFVKHSYFHCMLRDLSTILQVVSRLCNVVSTVIEDKDVATVVLVIRSLLFSIKLANTKKLYMYELSNQQVTTDLIDVHAQMLSSARTLILLSEEIYNNPDELFGLLDSVVQLLLPSKFDHVEPSIIVTSAAQLLVTISYSVRPSYIMKSPSSHVMDLLQNDLKHLDNDVRLLVKRFVFNCLLLPYSGMATNSEDQHYEQRNQWLQQYVNFTSNTLLKLESSCSLQTVTNVIKHELDDLKELLNFFDDTNLTTKQMLLSAYKSVIDKSIFLFTTFGKMNNEVFELIVNFYLTVIKVLQLQMGSQFVIQIIKMFLEPATTNQLSTESLNSIDKLLQMLLFVVVQSGSTANLLMPDILKLTIDNVLPLIFPEGPQNNQIDISDVTITLYSLFDAILHNKWNFLHRNANQQIKPADDGSLLVAGDYQEHLVKILTAYGRVLVGGSRSNVPTVVRIILASLEKVNNRWKLYEKLFFKTLLLRSFLCALVRLIVSPEGGMYYDMIINLLYNMSEKSKPALHEAFIEIGYAPSAKIIQQVCESGLDIPTFSSLMDQLVQDTKFSQFLQ